MGPGPPKQCKGGSKSASVRALNTPGLASSQWSSRASNDAGSSLADVPEAPRISGEGWNLKRYEREDEDLWGRDVFAPGQKLLDAIAKAGSSARRQVENRLNKTSARGENPANYYIAKNPPVNDLHPPVVSSQPASLDEVKWMLQPPPSAKVMEGKERVSRHRTGSSACSSWQEQPESLKASSSFEIPPDSKSRKPTNSSVYAVKSHPRLRTDSPAGQDHDRNASPSTVSSRGSGGRRRKRKKRPPPIFVTNDSDDSDVCIVKPVRMHGAEVPEKQARPPLLPTILSSSCQLPQLPTKGFGATDGTVNQMRPLLQEV